MYSQDILGHVTLGTDSETHQSLVHLLPLLQYLEDPLEQTSECVSLMVSNAGGVPQVFLTAPSGTVQIPVSAVQLHQVGGGTSHIIPCSYLIFRWGDFITNWSEPTVLICFSAQDFGGQAGRPAADWLILLPTSSCTPFPPDGCDRAAGREQQQPHRATGGEPGYRPQHQE